jgi:hypothetical protein
MAAKTNRIKLNKTDGLTIELIDGNITQTIMLDGKTITIAMVNGDKSSFIEQTADGITITADKFKVNSADISLNAIGPTAAVSLSAGPVPLLSTASLDLTVIPSIPGASNFVLSSLLAGEITPKVKLQLGGKAITSDTVVVPIPLPPTQPKPKLDVAKDLLDKAKKKVKFGKK